MQVAALMSDAGLESCRSLHRPCKPDSECAWGSRTVQPSVSSNVQAEALAPAGNQLSDSELHEWSCTAQYLFQVAIRNAKQSMS